MGDVASNLWGGINSGIGKLFGGGKDVVSGLSRATGQALSGTPGSTLPSLAQSISPIADVAGRTGDALGSFIGPSASPLSEFTGDIKSGLAGLVGDRGSGFSGTLGGVLNGVKTIAPALTLGASIYKATRPAPGVNDLKEFLNTNDGLGDLAADAGDQAKLLTRGANEAMEGRLPGGATLSIDAALRSAQAAIRSRYASLGLSGSTMEGQDLVDAERRALASTFQIGQQMAQTGLNAAAQQGAIVSGALANDRNINLNLYRQIMEAETKQGTEMGDALADFVKQLAA